MQTGFHFNKMGESLEGVVRCVEPSSSPCFVLLLPFCFCGSPRFLAVITNTTPKPNKNNTDEPKTENKSLQHKAEPPASADFDGLCLCFRTHQLPFLSLPWSQGE